MSNRNEVRWGILSTANIGRTKLIPAIIAAQHAKVVAVASRNQAKAESFAHDLGIACAYGSYEELLTSQEVDVVYNPLPNHMHIDWSLKALAAGKHVLCEKPLGCNVDDIARLTRRLHEFPQQKFMEAYMYRSHPQWIHIKTLLQSGAIGRVCPAHAHFTYNRDQPDDYRNNPEAGGGGLLDVGCYVISAVRWVLEQEPIKVCASLDIDQRYGVDRLFNGMLKFPTGASASVVAGTQCEPSQSLSVFGDKGSIKVTKPFYHDKDHIDSAVELTVDRKTRIETFNDHDQYCYMVDNFSRAILFNEGLSISVSESEQNMKVIDAFFESARANEWVDL